MNNESWKVSASRVTLFTIKPIVISDDINFLPKIFSGLEVEEVKKSSEKLIVAIDDNARYELKIRPLRIDFTISIKEEVKFSPPSFNVLGTFDEFMEEYNGLFVDWLNLGEIPEVSRIAWGAILLNEVTDHKVGLEQLSRYLPLTINTDITKEFNLEVNLPQSSSVIEDLPLNVISKWKILQAQLGLIGAESGSQMNFPDIFANRLELDINTDKEKSDELDKTKLVEILVELISYGKELQTKGISEL